MALSFVLTLNLLTDIQFPQKASGESGDIPCFVFGITNLEDEIYFQGAGNVIVNDPTSGAVNPDSVFWICSQTKMLVALAALKLIDQGKITFKTVVGDYIPEMKNPIILERASAGDMSFRPATTAITVQHLMNFTSGLYYPAAPPDAFGLDKGYTSKEMHQAADPVSAFFQTIKGKFPAVPLKFEPGTDFVYGWNSDVLGFLIEKVSGLSLEQFCQEHIFGPLDIRASFYLTPDLRQKLVNLAFRNEDGKLVPWADQFEIIEQDENKVRLHFGGTGIYTSMRDYLKLLRHLLQINAGIEVANPILTVESVRGIFIPALPEQGSKSLSDFMMLDGTQWSTALALATRDGDNGRKKGSAFWGGWAGTQHFMDPATGIAVVFGMQVVPRSLFDMEVWKVWGQLEKLTYAGVQHDLGKL